MYKYPNIWNPVEYQDLASDFFTAVSPWTVMSIAVDRVPKEKFKNRIDKVFCDLAEMTLKIKKSMFSPKLLDFWEEQNNFASTVRVGSEFHPVFCPNLPREVFRFEDPMPISEYP